MKEKNYQLENLRVISMIMVVIIHVANYYCREFNNIDNISYLGSLIFNVISRISVPIFFMISGANLLNKEYDYRKNKIRVYKKILVLFLITIIYYFWDKYYMGKNIEIISLLNKPERKLLWFMYAIISIYISLPFIKCLVDNLSNSLKKEFVILWLIFNGILKLFNCFNAYPVPIISGTYYLGYFIIGYFIVDNIEKIREKINLNLLIIIIFGLYTIIIIVSYISSIVLNNHFTGLLTYSNIFVMIASILSFTYLYINLKITNKNIINKLSYLSFGIYLIHGIILNIIMNYIPFKSITSFIGIPTISSLILIISIFVVEILKKNKYIRDYL